MSFKLRHLFGALILHGTLFAVLAGGVQCSRPLQRPPVIEAVLLDPNREETGARKRKEEARKRLEEQKIKEREETRRREEAEREQARTEAETRKQKELERKRKAEEDAGKKRQEAARREAEARESLEEAMQQETQQRQLDREQQARRKSEQDVALNNWIAQITDKVRRNWIRPLAAPETFECKVLVQQLPGGQVTNARIVESCGNPALDDSVVKAVLRSDPLPTVSDPSMFQREFTFRFVPAQ